MREGKGPLWHLRCVCSSGVMTGARLWREISLLPERLLPHSSISSILDDLFFSSGSSEHQTHFWSGLKTASLEFLEGNLMQVPQPPPPRLNMPQGPALWALLCPPAEIHLGTTRTSSHLECCVHFCHQMHHILASCFSLIQLV